MKNSSERLNKLRELENELGYHFNDISILNMALTHSSYVNENNVPKDRFNERHEFLGDAVLELVVSDYLFKKYPNSTEGVLTKKRAQLVCEKSFGSFGELLKLGEYLLLGKGEESSGGRHKLSILADTFEALCGAIYLDGGIFFIQNFLKKLIENSQENEEESIFIDYKSMFQEYNHKENLGDFSYELISEKGPSHDKEFNINLLLNKKIISSGFGKSIKKAEQDAAKKALLILGVVNE